MTGLVILLFAAAAPAPASEAQLRLLRRGGEKVAAARRAWAEGEQAGAVAGMAEAEALFREALGEPSQPVSDALRWLGLWEERRGRYKEALAYLTRLADGAEALWGAGHWRATECRWALRMARRSAALTPELRRREEEGRRLHRQSVKPHMEGDYATAIPLAEKALRLLGESVGEEDVLYQTCLGHLGAMLRETGDLAGALAAAEKVARIARDSLGERHPAHATALNNLGVLRKDRGDFRGALALYSRALAIYREASGEGRPEHTTTLGNIAMLHSAMGDYRAALPLLLRVLAAEEAAGSKQPHHALALNNLGMVYSRLKDHPKARGLFQQARDALRRAGLQRHPHFAGVSTNLAMTELEVGRPGDALPLLEEVLQTQRRALGERNNPYATTLINLACVRRGLGEYDAAVALLTRGLELKRALLGDDHPETIRSLTTLGGMYVARRRPGSALPPLEQALHLARRRLDTLAAVQSERQQLAAAAALRLPLSWRLALPDEAPLNAHDHVVAWKGAVFTAQHQRRLFLRLQGDERARGEAARLLGVTRQLALFSQRPDEASRRRAAELVREKDELDARLSKVSEEFRMASRPMTSAALRAALPDGVALADLFVYDGRGLRGEASWRPLLAAWVLRKDRPTERVDLGDAGEIEDAVNAWRVALEAGRGDAEAAAKIRRRLWEPLARRLAGAKVVLISPDGPMARLPFAALPGKEPGTYLIEEVALAVLPVPRLLPALLEPPGGPASLLAVGGVDFGTGTGRHTPLPGTRAEAAAVAAGFRKAFGAEAGLLTGTAATRAALAGRLPRVRLAHLATHGYFAPREMRDVLSGADARPDAPSRDDTPAGWHPGLLSGIVLAGANAPREDDDGLLTALEVAEMDLSGLELAVLSACQTGLGEGAAGEGALGLQRAFQMAGCRSVVTSLWSVDDAATSVLMERFYHHLWKEKRGKLDALRRAQMDVLRDPGLVEARAKELGGTRGLRAAGKASEVIVSGKRERRSPPAWWAAWQLSGDWR